MFGSVAILASLVLFSLTAAVSGAPSVASRSPTVNAKGVHPLAAVSLTFANDVKAQPARLIELRRFDTNYLLGSVSAQSSFVDIADKTATIRFPVAQVPSGKVYVTIEAGAFVDSSDSSEFAGITTPSWTFEVDSEF